MKPTNVSPANVNRKRLAALILFGLGITVFACQGIDYKTRDKVVDVGPIHVTAERTHNIALLPILGGIALFGGAVLWFARERRG